jgi:septum formation protein
LFLEGESGGDVSRPPPLILASTSRYRKELLGRFGVPFEAHPPAVEESARTGELPTDRARRLALEKAQAVASRFPDALVIGSDQVAAAGDGVLDKPGNAANARAQLERLSGSHARFYTACAVLCRAAHLHLAHLDTTSVRVRCLTALEIERYVAREAPYDCAGGFKAESLGITLFESIESTDPTALIGLPLIWLAGALRSAGYRLP